MPFRGRAARLRPRCTAWPWLSWVGVSRVALVGLLVTTFAGCGARIGPTHLAADKSVSNLGWDLHVASDDLLIAHLDLQAQRRRRMLAGDDLEIVRQSPTALVCTAAADVSGDVRGARDGVVALRNDTARVDGSLKVVGVDLLRLHEQLRTPGLSAATTNQLNDARTRAGRAMRRYSATAHRLAASAYRLLEQSASLGGSATRRCAQATKSPGPGNAQRLHSGVVHERSVT